MLVELTGVWFRASFLMLRWPFYQVLFDFEDSAMLLSDRKSTGTVFQYVLHFYVFEASQQSHLFCSFNPHFML